MISDSTEIFNTAVSITSYHIIRRVSKITIQVQTHNGGSARIPRTHAKQNWRDKRKPGTRRALCLTLSMVRSSSLSDSSCFLLDPCLSPLAKQHTKTARDGVKICTVKKKRTNSPPRNADPGVRKRKDLSHRTTPNSAWPEPSTESTLALPRSAVNCIRPHDKCARDAHRH